MNRLEAAVAMMHRFPTWCILVDKNRKIVDQNKIAEDNGARHGLPCYAAVAERKDTCTWCDIEGRLVEGALLSCSVELGYDETTGFVEEKGGMIRDAHWLFVDDIHFLHFGFVGLCSFEDQEEVLEDLRAFLGGVELPKECLEAIEATSRQFFT